MTGPRGRALCLMAGATWLALDLVRGSGPLISHLFDWGPSVVAPVTLGAFIGGAALAPLALLIGRGRGRGIAAVGMAVGAVILRVVLPFSHGDTRVGVGLIALGLALSLLVLALQGAVTAHGGGAALAASAIGACAGVLEQGILRTWDAVWRHDGLGWSACLLVCLVVLVSAWRARQEPSEGPVRGFWAFGLWFSLLAFAFANIAFLSSQADLHLSVSIVLCVVGLAAGVVASSRGPIDGAGVVMAVGVAATLATVGLVFLGGLAATVSAPVATASTTYLAGRAVRVEPQRTDGTLRLVGASAALGLTALLPFMLVQLDYEIPLGFPHLLVIVATTAGLAVGGLAASRERYRATVETRPSAGPIRLALVAIVLATLVAIPSALTFATGAPPVSALPDDLRVVTWNLHYGVTPRIQGGPDVDLPGIVHTLRAQDADVLVLQEVERGWVLGSGTDLLQVLADALDMNYVFVGTHDRQFGNAILSRYTIVDPVVIPLPYGAGPQRRAALVATIETEAGPVRVASLHLQNHNDGATRVAEIEAFLAALPDDDVPTLVGGDFNDTPTSATMSRMRAAGFTSIQDALDAAADTYVGADFVDRIDYLWERGLDPTDFVLGSSPLSDHLSLAATVSPASTDTPSP